MRARPPWWGPAIGILIILTGLCRVAPYSLRVATNSPSAGVGLGLGLGSGPGRPQTYMALSGDLLVEIRQLPVWARGRKLQLMLLEHVSNGPPVAVATAASIPPEYSVQGSVPVNVPTGAPTTAANTGGRLQWVRGYNRSSGGGGAVAGRALGKMTSTWKPDIAAAAGNARAAGRPGGQPNAPTTLKPLVARFPCGFVSRGGRYALRLAGLDRVKKYRTKEDADDGSSENESGERPSSSNRVPADGGALKPAEAASTTTSTTTTTTTTASTTTTAATTAGVGGPAGTRPGFIDPALPATNETGGLFLLDVLWPRARLTLSPKEIVTYPEEAVRASVEFMGVRCPSAKGSPLSESWLELVYCGPVLSDCTYNNYTQRQILHSEQVLGYPHQLTLPLQCELFGMAGHYSLRLRAGRPSLVDWPVEGGANATIKAVWSDRFVFNVHARSIFPCGAHSGVSALFTYPGCVLPAGDRVRLFARLRADVSTLLPPLTLQYVAEQRVAKGTHSVSFDCDLFSERYVEYCFVYVSQAITGAVTDVRMDCVPTLPVSEADSGSWGSWSPWSACTSTCGGGTRNRYRFCDSPPPRYGAKFCEGSSLETMRCGPDNEWDCAPEGVSADLPLPLPPAPYPAARPGAAGAVGAAGAAGAAQGVSSGCRCGCVVHLGTTKPATLLASSSKSCPGRSFWLVQADANHVVRLWVQQQRLSCGAQWLRVRDGDSLGGRLLLALDSEQGPSKAKGPHRQRAAADEAVSSSNTMLVEFYSDEAVAALEECAAGFLAHAQQAVPPNETLVGYPLAVAGAGAGVGAGLVADDGGWWAAGLRLTVVHAAAVAFLGGVLLLSTCLCAQYGHRYRKYQLTAAKEDQETLSLTDNEETGVLVRASSSATLVSEVMSMKGFRMSREPQKPQEEETSVLGGSSGSAESVSGSVTVSVGSPLSGTGSGSGVSAAPLGPLGPLGPPLDATASLPNSPQPNPSPQPSPSMRRSGSCERPALGALGPQPQPQGPRRPGSARVAAPRLMSGSGLVSPVREEDQQGPLGLGAKAAAPCGPGDAPGGATDGAGAADAAAALAAPPAAAPGPGKWRPLPTRLAGLARGVASNASSTSTLVNDGSTLPAGSCSPGSSVRSWSRASCTSTTSSMASVGSLGSSSSRTATPTPGNPLSPGAAPGPLPGQHPHHHHLLRHPTNPKESKDRRNRERLLRAAGSGGGSEFSLGPDTELEMDYYDYNVHNACAAPGSLLGMDPAYLLWIPPFTPGSAGSWEEDGEDGVEGGQLFDSDGGGSSGEADPLHPRHPDEGTELQELRSPPGHAPAAAKHFVQGTLQLQGVQAQIHTARVTELTVKETEAEAKTDKGSAPGSAPGPPPLTLQELTSSPRRVGRQPPPGPREDAVESEKETAVVKSPSDQRLLYRLHQDDEDDIKFADDGDDDDCEDIFVKDSKVDPKMVPLLGRRSDLNV